jgi:hypothetical protein
VPVGVVRCLACRHPEVRELDLWLRDDDGRATRTRNQTSERFGLPTHVLARHLKAGHWKSVQQWATLDASHAAARAKARGTVALPDSDDPAALDGISQLEAMLAELGSRDVSEYGPRDLLQHGDQMRRVAESVARLKPPADKEGPAQAKVRALEDILAAYDAVLDRHPEIAAEVAAAMHNLREAR